MENVNNFLDENLVTCTIDKNSNQRYTSSSSEGDNKRKEFLETICEMLVNYKNLEGHKNE